MGSKTKYILIGLIVLLVIYYWKDGGSQENFVETPYVSANNLAKYYESPTKGIDDYLVDNMTCSVDCCGDQGQVPLDGLMPKEIHQCINNAKSPGPYVRTGYRCANGINGVGCPCINRRAYKFLANHGKEPTNLSGIEPTLLINSSPVSGNEQSYTPYELIQIKKSAFAENRMLNDLELRRPIQNLDAVQMSENL